MDLAIATARSNDRAILQLGGSVDLANRDELVAAGRKALRDQSPSALVIDLAEVSYLDSSGIGALVTLAGASEDAGVTFSLQAPSPPVSRVLDVCGLIRVWPNDRSSAGCRRGHLDSQLGCARHDQRGYGCFAGRAVVLHRVRTFPFAGGLLRWNADVARLGRATSANAPAGPA